MKQVIVATLWHGPQVEGVVDPAAPPTEADLDAISDSLTCLNCGVKPVVRVVEDATPPRYIDTGEPICEDVARWRGWC